MVVTESEALKRWCPFARSPIQTRFGLSTGNRGIGSIDKEWLCLASGCMAWRHTPDAWETTDKPLGADEDWSNPAPPDGDGWVLYGKHIGYAKWRRPAERSGYGYCGLAGKPE